MCGGLGNAPKAFMPAAAMMKAERKENKRERKQERLTDRYDEVAERRIAKEEALAAEMKAIRQEARQDARAQEGAVASMQGDSYQSQSAPTPTPTAAQSTQVVVGQNSGLQAPGAALSGRKGRRAARRADASSSLRIGPASTGSGAGPNVAV